ncbi:MAG TPA: glycoside hydrolase family 3 N-terminal domain-containing protein [Blastocatellia bacterium]|nr:glycoside hydrolase family 3 N-terminal domain-containing protein [Blastocatellia bacterium]
MKLEHRMGQLLIVGLPGPQLDSVAKELLETVQPGGVILTGRNIESAEQLSELTSAIRSSVIVPPLIALDQEGGPVDRLKGIYSATPSPDLLRASKDASAAARLGEVTAEALRILGFNVNLAPVIDIAVDDSAPNGLQGRYLGSASAEVARLSGAYLEGLQHGGIVGVGKHFPGLGGAAVDPHFALPQIDTPREQMLNQVIQPYTELFSKINARLNAVLIGHAHYTAFDGHAPLPASLSRNIVTGLLREELDFKGLAITDDLQMEAITSTRTTADAAIAAVDAGNDMVMIAGTPDAAAGAWEAMTRAAQEGRISRQRISKSFDNIARVKSMLSPPHALSESSIDRLRDRIAELNVALQQSR